MTHLRKMMLEELERRNYAQTTIDGYLRAVAEFSLLLPSPSASHTPLRPPSTPVHRLPYATHRRYRKPNSHHTRPHPGGGFLQVVVSEATAPHSRGSVTPLLRSLLIQH